VENLGLAWQGVGLVKIDEFFLPDGLGKNEIKGDELWGSRLERNDHAMDVTRELSAEQRAQADRIEDILKGAAAVEIRRMAELLASKSNGELFGQTEFQLRDILLGLGNRALDAALSERKKGGTKVRA